MYTNLLFTGAHKLFVTRLLKEEDIEREKSIMHQHEQEQAVEPNYLECLEDELERFIIQGRKRAGEDVA